MNEFSTHPPATGLPGVRHIPDVGWQCARCRCEWPCDTYKWTALRDYRRNRVALAMLMATYLDRFARDRPVVECARARAGARFLGWCRTRRPGRAAW
ncbi:hypothetical protein ACIA8K_13825 [Catenuloplanes sp. NPDC051500]|uniref:hypothetical protein n=1 Tax=Catenuloplanes sp. NPDC051500 TaxID=3363959 RepID=UPI00378B3890